MIEQMDDQQLDAFTERYLSEMRSTDDERIEYWELLDGMIATDPDNAWRVIIRLLQSVDIYSAGRLATGPLETLLVRWPAYVSRAVSAAADDATLRDLLALIAIADLPPEDQRRIRECCIVDRETT